MSRSVYDFNDVKKHVTCRRYLESRGISLNAASRCAATWRGGKNPNVHVYDKDGVELWKDFKTDEGGTVIDLCMKIEGFTDVQDAANALGERFTVPPKARKRKPAPLVTRGQMLLAKGFVLDATYDYTDEDGKPVYFVDRYRWPDLLTNPPDGCKRKEFVQRTPEHEGLDADTPQLLYHLPEVVAAKEVFIVEGEKDVETLRAWGFVATTNSGGASKDGSKKWPSAMNKHLAGKDIVIIGDNDDKGRAHAQNLRDMLAPVAASLRTLTISTLPKGDVTDWATKEGGTPDKLRDFIDALPVPVRVDAKEEAQAAAIAAAKNANLVPFANFSVVEESNGKRTKAIRVPRTVDDLRADMYTRFLGFPRRLGASLLFDHDKDNGRIRELRNEHALFAWVGEKSRHVVPWTSGMEGFVSKKELYSSLLFNSTAYEKISTVPDYPMRSDVYYTYRDALKPTPGHQALAEFLAQFNPASEADAVLLRTFVAAPMFYEYMIQRPCWIIDATFGQGSGKTTLAELLAFLYDSTAIKTDMNEMTFKGEEIKKRIVSSSGRNARMFLVDNVRGAFSCPFFAELVTSTYFSGRAPYGEGEERRPNDLTFVVTSNAATVDSDMASRSISVYIGSRQDKSGAWMRRARDLVQARRYEILGDIFDILSNGPSIGDGYQAVTRTPEFERDVLWKMAGSKAAFNKAIEHILATRTNINVEGELAGLITEAVEMQIDRWLAKQAEHPNLKCPKSHELVAVWLRTAVVEHWIKPQFKVDIQTLRNMVDTGKAPRFARGIKKYPRSGAYGGSGRSSGILYVGAHIEFPYIPVLTMDENNVVLAGSIGWHHNPALVAELAEQNRAAENGDAIDVDAVEMPPRQPLPPVEEIDGPELLPM